MRQGNGVSLVSRDNGDPKKVEPRIVARLLSAIQKTSIFFKNHLFVRHDTSFGYSFALHHGLFV